MLADRLEDNTVDDAAPIPRSVKQKIMDHVYRQSGISLDELTCNFVDTLLRRRLRALGISEPEAYIDYVDSHLEEVKHLIDAYTTNETSFFRTRSLWHYLETSLLPELAALNMPRTPSLWSAACSSGEEAYSLAMLSAEIFKATRSKPPRIYATDISTDMLQKAQDGIYSGRSIKRLNAAHPEMLETHFTCQDDQYQVNEALRKQIRFSRHNLMEETGKRDTYDLVLLRNVLIYFKPADQMKIVSNIFSALRPGGVLAIGESESLAFYESNLEYVQPFVYRKPRS